MKKFITKILGADFLVLFDSPDLDAVGISNDCKRVIKIDPTLHKDVQVEIFWHEVSHMILALTGLSHTLSEGQDEAIAQSFGFALARFFTDNVGILHLVYRSNG